MTSCFHVWEDRVDEDGEPVKVCVKCGLEISSFNYVAFYQ